MEQHLSIIISILTLISIIWVFRDKVIGSGKADQKIDDRVSELERSDIDLNKCIDNINQDIKTIKENHLFHIQNDMADLKGEIKEIKAILSFLKEK